MIVLCVLCGFFFFKQKTAYEMRISDWSSDVCSSDLAMLSDIGPDRRCGEAAQREDRLDDVQAVRAIEVITVPAARPQMPVAIEIVGNRSEERRVGKECVSTCSYRWSPYH